MPRADRSSPDLARDGVAPLGEQDAAHSPLQGIDRLVHEPARMAILTVLAGVAKADFTFLQRSLGLTQGNLSSHLSRLEAADLVHIDKTFVRRSPRTFVRITDLGRAAITTHWERLDALRHHAAAPPEAEEETGGAR